MLKLFNNLKDFIQNKLSFRFNISLKRLIFITIATIIASGALFSCIKRSNIDDSTKIENSIISKYKLTRSFDGLSWGTYWRNCGAWFTADHVVANSSDDKPDFVKGDLVRSDYVIDAAAYGLKKKCKNIAKPENGMNVYILAYPAGSESPSLRYGKILTRRSVSGSDNYFTPTWVVVFDNMKEGVISDPVVGGMSGGIVVNKELTPIGILVTQNSPTDINMDGFAEQSADMVGIDDVYDILLDKVKK